MNRRRIQFCAAVALLLAYSIGYAYELGTHARLTYKAYGLSVLKADEKLVKELGLDLSNPDSPFGNIYYDVSGSHLRERNVSAFEAGFMSDSQNPNGVIPIGTNPLSLPGWLMRGAIREDDSYGEDNPQDDLFNPNLYRVLHHFFDPVNNRALTNIGLGLLDSDIHTAPAWAIGTTSANAFTSFNTPQDGRRNHFTVFDAREAMYRALTGKSKSGNEVATSQAERNKYWATTFWALGDVLHLVQDMAQPQHTRNEIHAGRFPEALTGHASVLEKYIEARAIGARFFNIDDQTNVRIEPLSAVLSVGYPIPRFTKYSDFWSTRPGGGGAAGDGLADYSNRGFFTAGKNLGSNEYPLPVNNSGAYTAESAEGLLPHKPRQRINFLRGNVPDNRVGLANIRMTTEGLFDLWLVNTPPSYTLNRFNYDDQAALLIPRAVAYSAGLIDYFFRGRLEAEDVEFIDSGIRLRVKNAIDSQKTPAWTNEILYAMNTSGSRGQFVLAFEYKDNNGQTRYGSSSPVAAKSAADGGGDLAPGATSNATYEFPVSVPTDARDVKYRLVFRGKLGQEEDAVAVGPAEPVSGFLVSPSYLPADGIGGRRAIYRRGGQWILDTKPRLEAGNVDWKGWYVNGRPTKVLSWRGPDSRYFSDSETRWGVDIYQNGDFFAFAPNVVLGAALVKDTAGRDWLVAICREGNADVIYRRPGSANNPEAPWAEIGRFNAAAYVQGSVISVFSADTPWFFSGSGREAQTMRRWKGADSPYAQLARLKIVFNPDVTQATYESLGNSSGFREDRLCTGSVERGLGTVKRTIQTTGEYIIAVDYKGEQEVPAKVHLEALTVIDEHGSEEGGESKSEKRWNEYFLSGTRQVAHYTAARNGTTSWTNTVSPGNPNTWMVREVNENGSSSTYGRQFLLGLDLREDAYAYTHWTDTDSFGRSTRTGAVNQEAETTSEGADIDLTNNSVRIYEINHPPTVRTIQPPALSRRDILGCAPATTSYRYGTLDFSAPNGLGSAFAIDSNGNVAASLTYQEFFGFERKQFYYLSNGSLEEAIPGGSTGANYAPIGVLR